MKVEFSEHFWKRFEERKRNAPVELTKEILLEAISRPDLIIPDPKNPSREWRIRKIEGYCLKVIVEVMSDGLVALTLFFDRKLRRQGLCE